MKNVAKCDTWCELQNPANHRVFERKLRPKPLGRGHVCLGVTHRVATPPSRGAAETGLPCPFGAAGLKASPRRGRHDKWWLNFLNSSPRRAVSPRRLPDSLDPEEARASTATPGQAGLPAEFKHINKRRKRN